MFVPRTRRSITSLCCVRFANCIVGTLARLNSFPGRTSSPPRSFVTETPLHISIFFPPMLTDPEIRPVNFLLLYSPTTFSDFPPVVFESRPTPGFADTSWNVPRLFRFIHPPPQSAFLLPEATRSNNPEYSVVFELPIPLQFPSTPLPTQFCPSERRRFVPSSPQQVLPQVARPKSELYRHLLS